MAAELILTPEFLEDIIDVADWYDHQIAGLGQDFLEGIDACIDKIAKMPTIYEMVKRNYRRALVRRFPYAIFFESVDSRVTVYAVIHTARHPDTWRERLP
jgi:plasmid stabilization system protein ParE